MRFAWLALAACSFQHGAATHDGAPPDMPPDTSLAACTTQTCRKPITIHGNRVTGGPHGDFPVLLHLASDADLAAKSANGHDLVFTDALGVPLSYERELYVAQTGELVAWVRVPSLPSVVDTLLFLDYGGDASVDHQDAAGTWIASYQQVLHLDEIGGTTFADSTAQRTSGTGQNGLATNVAGQLVNAAGFDGIDDQIYVAKTAGLTTTGTTGTLSLWIWWSALDTSDYHRVMSNTNHFVSNFGGYEWSTQVGTDDFYFYPNGGPINDYNLGANPFTAQTWQHVAVTIDFPNRNVVMYVDGAPMTITETLANATNWTAAGQPDDWIWGGAPQMTGAFDGKMDEIHVANAVRTPGWIATEFANEKDPGTFYSVGAPVAP